MIGSIYTTLRGPLHAVAAHAAADMQTLFEFDKATDRVQFLFGRDVVSYVNGMRQSLIKLGTATTMLENNGEHLPPEERSRQIKVRYEEVQKTANFYTEFPKLMGAYVRMDQKYVFGSDHLKEWIARRQRN